MDYTKLSNVELMKIRNELEDTQQLGELNSRLRPVLVARKDAGVGPGDLIRGESVSLVEHVGDATIITAIRNDGSVSHSLIVDGIQRSYKRASGVRSAYKRATGRELDWDVPAADGTWYRSHVRGNAYKSEWYLYRTAEAAAERAKGAERWFGAHDVVAVELHGGPFYYVYA